LKLKELYELKRKMNFGNQRTPTLASSTRSGNFKPEGRSNRLKRFSYLSGSPSTSLNDSNASLNKKIRVEYENRFNQYDFSLNLYTIPPFGQIGLEEAQKAVEERLKILSVLEDVKADQAKSKIPFNFQEEFGTRLFIERCFYQWSIWW